MPNGKIQPEFQNRLAGMGDWLKIYGESIYNTKAGFSKPTESWSSTQNGKKIYLHILDPKTTAITFAPVPFKKIKKAYLLNGGASAKYTLKKGKLELSTIFNNNEIDNVVVLEVE